MAESGCFEPLELSVPGVRNIRKIGTIHDALYPEAIELDGFIDWEVICEDHGRVQPQVVVSLDQFSVGSSFVKTQMWDANF